MLQLETINGTRLVPDVRSPPVKWTWSLPFQEGVEEYDYVDYQCGPGAPNPLRLVVAVADFILGRMPVPASEM